ncbi:component of SufBCD complex [Rhodobacteraceae bacterium HSP-20]|uniref:Component of SufBCD complex n=2 Tax=Paragemmobacter amnigenus TaxID=2852097 RepID=A0ABS6J3T1_9RHOB|nr:component of SufBCD complex [Rhodobacter amnigenus]MBV4389638.1 component of SufBCD complex [Rhodobacter amnigenus]
MDWYRMIFEVIDMRSFSNLWFWIALAVLWSTTSHFVLGVPHDLFRRALREGGQPLTDTEHLAHIYCRRLLYITRMGGLFLVAFLSFLTTGLLVLAVVYGIEFAQALLCLLVPLLLVGFLNLRASRAVERDALTGDDLLALLRRHRMALQTVGMFAIFFTGMFGMFQNVTRGVFG